MQTITEILRSHPELAIFLTLSMGFLIGKIQFGNFKFGAVLGTLFAGLLVGQLDIPINSVIKIFFFDLFLFATGYKVGPQFFRGLKKDALPQLGITLVVCVVSLFTAFLVAKVMHYDVGIAAGLIAGAFTESTIIGTAAEAIQRLSIPDIEKANLINNIPIAYAATYLVGTTGVIIFLPEIAPRILKVNLSRESKKFESELLNKNNQESIISPFDQDWDVRVFKVNNPKWEGITVGEIEKLIPDARIVVEKLKINGGIIEAENSIIVNHGDLIALSARKNIMAQILEIGDEIFDKELLNIDTEQVNLVVTKSKISGMMLSEIADKFGRGIKLHRLVRSGQEMPFSATTKVNSGDLLEVSGSKQNLEKTAGGIGYLEKNTISTDIVFVGLGIVIGGLIGLLAFNFFGIDLTLTTSGGALVMGLFFGWLRSKRPTFGRIPDSALWIFDNLGLTVFIAVVGIQSGPGLMSGLAQTGYFILLSGLVVALVPHIIGLLVGFYIFRMNPVILLGVLCGAGTNTSALKAVQDKSLSKYPVLGYTIPYALGNILLTAWGPVIVSMMS